MGGRGSSNGRVLTADKLISVANSPINAKKAGAAFRNLSHMTQGSINRGLRLSEPMQSAIRENRTTSNGKINITDEYTAALNGDKARIKVVTSVSGGKLEYTVKQANKVLLKSGSKDRVAGQVAQFLQKRLKERAARR